MGGIPTDTKGHVLADTASAVLPGLYAVGECACVSVHGANRLGCNSLIDLVVFGCRTGLSILDDVKGKVLQPLPLQAESIVVNKITGLLESAGIERAPILREVMQRLMTEKCSVFRNGKTLEEALVEIRQLEKRCLNLGLTNKSRIFNYELEEALELSNMLRIAEVIVFSALKREESRGSHFRSDFPARNDEVWLRHTFVHEMSAGLKETHKPVAITKFAPQKRSY
jgi:succinate dehydrogenase / fumarate reductase flavoprotein subunit